MLVELHVESSGAEVGTLQTPGRQFVRGKEKPVECVCANVCTALLVPLCHILAPLTCTK